MGRFVTMPCDVTSTEDCRVPDARGLWVTVLLAGLAASSLVFGAQALSGAYRSEVASDPDEAGHFTSGMMVYHYCRAPLGTDPVAFAESFYVRYPRVNFVWPPAFEVMQAVAYILLGPGKPAALLLVGSMAAATVAYLFRRLAASLGFVPASLALLVLLNPLIMRYESVVMAEMGVCLFSTLAVFAFVDYVVDRRLRDAVAFATWSVLAILTKGTALALIVFIPLAIAISGRWSVLGHRIFWAAGPLVVAIAACSYGLTMLHGVGLHGHASIGHMIENSTRFHDRPAVLGEMFPVATPGLWLLAAVGVLRVLPRCAQGRGLDVRGRCEVAAAAAWLIAILTFQTLSPIRELRYFLPALVPLTILAAHGLEVIRGALGRRSRLAAGVTVAALAASTVAIHRGAMPARYSGFGAIAEAIPSRPGGRVILISSGELGEGAFIVERLLRDHDRSDAVLRGSKVLFGSRWRGDYQLRLKTVEEVRAYIEDVPVHNIIVDEYEWPGREAGPHRALLSRALAADPAAFPLVGVFPLRRDERPCQGSIKLYENRAARDREFRVIRIDMTDRLPGRVLELRNPRIRPGPE